MTDLIAYTNQRFQLTVDVFNSANLYTALGSATWIMQVRQKAAAQLLLDFRTGGSLTNPAVTATYDSVNRRVVFRAPTSALALFSAGGAYAYDYGFVIPGSDFVRVDGGALTFNAGITQAGVIGSPAPPAGAADTVISTNPIGANDVKPSPTTLTVTNTDTFAPLGFAWDSSWTPVIWFRGLLYFAPAVTASGTAVTWDAISAGSNSVPTHITQSDPAPILIAM